MKPLLTKTTIILAIAFLSRALMACCDCFKYGHYNYDRVDIYPLDNSGPSPTVSPADSINRNTFGLRFDFSVILVAHHEGETFNSFSSAQAIDCFCGENILPRSVVSKIEIFTVHDFDGDHPANSDVTDLFKILNDDHVYEDIQDYFNTLPLLGARVGIVTYDALLLTPPVRGGDHAFKIRTTMTDGRVFASTTTPVKLY